MELFDIISSRKFNYETCFLCGIEIKESSKTKEHVFPKWLLNKFNLWNEKLTLLNRTEIKYSQLTIPCCEKCNNEYLSKIENEIQKGVEGGYEKFKEIEEEILHIWLCKILYGVLFKEVLIPFDRSKKDLGSIFNEEQLEQYKIFHLFLQGARIPIKYNFHKPFLIYVFNLKIPDNKKVHFDFSDSLVRLSISLKLGDIGIIGNLQDGGAQYYMCDEFYSSFNDKKLHPIQFAELSARFFYETTLINRIPKFIVANNDNYVEVMQLSLQGFSTKSIYDDFEMEDYAKFLATFLGFQIENIFFPPDKIWTCLKNETDEFLEISFEDLPI